MLYRTIREGTRGDVSSEGPERSMGKRREEGERGHRVSVALRERIIIFRSFSQRAVGDVSTHPTAGFN